MTRTTILITETFLQLFLKLASTPALHELQLQHSCSWSLLHLQQSRLFTAKPELTGFHVVSFTYENPHSDGGLQHPDCSKIKQKIREVEEVAHCLFMYLNDSCVIDNTLSNTCTHTHFSDLSNLIHRTEITETKNELKHILKMVSKVSIRFWYCTGIDTRILVS